MKSVRRTESKFKPVKPEQAPLQASFPIRAFLRIFTGAFRGYGRYQTTPIL